MPSQDYHRIEQAIRYLQVNRDRQPSLANVADHLGLSAPYLQRVFRRWAGVSPKTLLQHFTVEHAKRRLRATSTVLEAAYDAGLSGPSRLHEHFVTLEAVTPGEYRSLGEDLRIEYGVHDSPFGPYFLAATSRGVCGMQFLDDGNARNAIEDLRRTWPAAVVQENVAATETIARRIFAAPRPCSGAAPLPLLARGTNFQVNVWRALLAVPEGATTTYRAIAEAIGRPTASRAVGNAVGANPIAMLIPCHRVLRQLGHFGGYRWGIERKTAILAWESARTSGGAE